MRGHRLFPAAQIIIVIDPEAIRRTRRSFVVRIRKGDYAISIRIDAEFYSPVDKKRTPPVPLFGDCGVTITDIALDWICFGWEGWMVLKK